MAFVNWLHRLCLTVNCTAPSGRSPSLIAHLRCMHLPGSLLERLMLGVVSAARYCVFCMRTVSLLGVRSARQPVLDSAWRHHRDLYDNDSWIRPGRRQIYLIGVWLPAQMWASHHRPCNLLGHRRQRLCVQHTNNYVRFACRWRRPLLWIFYFWLRLLLVRLHCPCATHLSLCRGSGTYGETSPPNKRFASMSCGDFYCCGCVECVSVLWCKHCVECSAF